MSVPAAITSALTDAGIDAAIIAGSVLAILVGIKAFKYMQSAIGAGNSAAMWDRVNDRAIDINAEHGYNDNKNHYATSAREEIARSRWY